MAMPLDMILILCVIPCVLSCDFRKKPCLLTLKHVNPHPAQLIY